MPTLTIDSTALAVIGIPTWSPGSSRGGRPAAAHIEATVQVPPTIRMLDLDKTPARVVLDYGDGSSVAGEGMWRVGGLRTDGDTARVRFEGDSVVQRT